MADKKIPFSFAKRFGVLLENIDEHGASICYVSEPNLLTTLELRRYLTVPLKLKQISQEQFEQQLADSYQTDTQTAMQLTQEQTDDLNLDQVISNLPKTEDLLEDQTDAPLIKLLNAILSEAIKQGASDVHIETFEHTLSVRFRIDGVLRKIVEPQYQLAPLIVSRFKVMAQLNIAEKRLPQDGRLALTIGHHHIDVRVSTMPTSHGERVVLRLLDKRSAPLDLQSLGMHPNTLQVIQRLISKPHGIILVTGPTGSGKTTTLYAALTQLNKPECNILTVEDPVEYYLPGIGQTQINPKANLTFAKGLRAILRQDPDIVMIGEIRDAETAEIAIQASLTGHLVLSTLHTNTAIGAITRLRDMGIEAFLLGSSLIGVIAQRLIRLLCPHCKQAQPATSEEAAIMGIATGHPIFHPTGCNTCHQSGYLGRSGIYEAIMLDETMQSFITQGAEEAILLNHARQSYPGIRTDGIERVLAGETSLAEVLRVLGEG